MHSVFLPTNNHVLMRIELYQMPNPYFMFLHFRKNSLYSKKLNFHYERIYLRKPNMRKTLTYLEILPYKVVT